jgi:predicted kinase
MRPVVIVISGMPGSGKTTLAHVLAASLHLPVVSRDDLKTGMHVTIESTERHEIARFGVAAFEVFYATVQLLVANGVSVIVEAAFHRDRSTAELQGLAAVADVAHIAIRIDEQTALDRYRQRAERGERHAAHADLLNLDRLRTETANYRLALPEPMLLVNTSAGYRPTLPEISAFISACRGQG